MNFAQYEGIFNSLNLKIPISIFIWNTELNCVIRAKKEKKIRKNIMQNIGKDNAIFVRSTLCQWSEQWAMKWTVSYSFIFYLKLKDFILNNHQIFSIAFYVNLQSKLNWIDMRTEHTLIKFTYNMNSAMSRAILSFVVLLLYSPIWLWPSSSVAQHNSSGWKTLCFIFAKRFPIK